MYTLVVDIVFIIIFALYLYWIFGLLRALKSDAPYVPIKGKVLDSMITMADAKPGDVWIDLGSGDGRILIAAAKRYDIKGEGIEKAGPIRILSRVRIWATGLGKRIRVRPGNFFTIDMSHADIISFYLLPEAHEKLYHKLKKELKPGAKILYHRFPISGIHPDRIDRETEMYRAVAPF